MSCMGCCFFYITGNHKVLSHITVWHEQMEVPQRPIKHFFAHVFFSLLPAISAQVRRRNRYIRGKLICLKEKKETQQGLDHKEGKCDGGGRRKERCRGRDLKKTRGNNKGSERKIIERLERERPLLKTAAEVGLAVRQQVNRGLLLSPLWYCWCTHPPFESTNRAEVQCCDSQQHITRLNSAKMTRILTSAFPTEALSTIAYLAWLMFSSWTRTCIPSDYKPFISSHIHLFIDCK